MRRLGPPPSSRMRCQSPTRLRYRRRSRVSRNRSRRVPGQSAIRREADARAGAVFFRRRFGYISATAGATSRRTGGCRMARITVEDCLENVDNRFQLVLLAAKRAKQLLKGSRPLLDSENKEVVTALREIAENKVKLVAADAPAVTGEPTA